MLSTAGCTGVFFENIYWVEQRPFLRQPLLCYLEVTLNCGASGAQTQPRLFPNTHVRLTSAWRGKPQGRHLVYGSHLCPRQVLRKTLHGTQSSQQLRRTVEKGKSYFMHQIENIFSTSFQKSNSKVISGHRAPNTCSTDKAKVQRIWL